MGNNESNQEMGRKTGKLCDIFQRIKYLIGAVVVLGIRTAESLKYSCQLMWGGKMTRELD